MTCPANWPLERHTPQLNLVSKDTACRIARVARRIGEQMEYARMAYNFEHFHSLQILYDRVMSAFDGYGMGEL